MRRPARRRGYPLRIESLAGWVFADLLLVLFIVGIGAQAATPKVEPPPPPLGMQPTPQVRTISVNARLLLDGTPEQKAAETASLDAQIQQATADLDGSRAGMTLIWGHNSNDNVSRGQEIAQAVGDRLEAAKPDVFTGGAEKYLWFGAPEGTVDLEIFLFND